MSPASWPAEAWSAAGVVVAAGLTFLGVLVTRRQVDSAQRTTERASERRDAVDGYDKLTARLEDRLHEVETRLSGVEGQLRDSTRIVRSAVAYIERLLDAWPEGTEAPPPVPLELSEHVATSALEDWRRPAPPAGAPHEPA